MKTIMIDMDDVITCGSIKRYIEEFYNIKIDLDKVNIYSYVQEYTKNKSKEFWNFMNDKDFYQDSPLLDGCLEVLEKLNKKYDIYIVTSYLWNEVFDLSGNTLKDKYYYLKEKLPFIKPEKYIFTTNKNIINFDIRIDDKVSNLEGSDTKLLFTAWHNKNLTSEELKSQGIVRVNSWYDISKILLNDNIDD